MARHSKPDFLDIINQYPWDNMQKHIVGEAIRQFIVNILDSTAEMLLTDGRTIEEAITMLRNAQDAIRDKIASIENNSAQQDLKISALQQAVTALQQAVEQLKNITPEPGGSTLAFSDQFKKINEVVYLNLKWITANSPDVPEEPGSPIVPNVTSNITPNVTDDGTNILGWDKDTFISSSYDEELGEYRFEALVDWHVDEIPYGSAAAVFPIALMTNAEIAQWNNAQGNTVSFQIDWMVSPYLYMVIRYPDGGEYPFYSAWTFDTRGATFIGIAKNGDWANQFNKFEKQVNVSLYGGRVDTLKSCRIMFLFQGGKTHIPAGSVFYIRGINVSKIQL